MNSSQRQLRLLQIACVLTLFASFRLSLMPRVITSSSDLVRWIALTMAIACAVGGFNLQRLILRGPRTPRMRSSLSTPFTRWRAGHLVRLTFATAVGLWGLNLREFGGATWQVNSLFAIALLLLLIWRPGESPDPTQPNDNDKRGAKTTWTGHSIVLIGIISALTILASYRSTVKAPQVKDSQRLPAIQGARLFFAPIGNFPVSEVQQLAYYYRQRFSMEIPILKAVPIPDSARDNSRQQLRAEKMSAELRDFFPELANDPKVIVIGITSEDMYIVSKSWGFAFGWRDVDTRTAIVSSARMNPSYFGAPFSDSSRKLRVRKMVTKDIGILYFGLPQSDDSKSVLYKGILGIQELDAVGEDF